MYYTVFPMPHVEEVNTSIAIVIVASGESRMDVVGACDSILTKLCLV